LDLPAPKSTEKESSHRSDGLLRNPIKRGKEAEAHHTLLSECFGKEGNGDHIPQSSEG
ncbi:hypothetical protein KI387_017762, partial [Taxus chinensis]